MSGGHGGDHRGAARPWGEAMQSAEVSAAGGSSSEQELGHDAVGVPTLVYFVLSAIAPLSSVIGYLPLVFAFGDGSGTAGAFLIGAVVWIVFSVGYTRMSLHIRNAGAFSAYISQGLGRTPGVIASYLAFSAYIILLFAVYGLFGYGMKVFIEPRIHVDLPWWVWSMACAVVVLGLAYRRIDVGARVVAVLSSAEILLIVIVSLAVLFTHRPEGMSAQPFEPSHVFSGSVGIAMIFAFGVFIGFESTVVYSEEARNPRRTIPIATYIGTALIGVVFVLVAYAQTVGWGADNIVKVITGIFSKGGDPSLLFSGLAKDTLGTWAVDAVQVLFVTSVFAFLLAFHNITARYMFSLGRSGLLPRPLSITHPKFRSPAISSVVQTVVVLVVLAITAGLGWDPYLQVSAWFAALGVLAFLVLYAATALAIVAYFVRTKADTSVWATKAAPLLSGAAIVWAIVLTVQNFNVYVGTGHQTAGYVLELLVVATIVIGFGVAQWLRVKRPAVYAAVGMNAEQPQEDLQTTQAAADPAFVPVTEEA